MNVIRWVDFPVNQWLKVQLFSPLELDGSTEPMLRGRDVFLSRRSGLFVMYRAILTMQDRHGKTTCSVLFPKEEFMNQWNKLNNVEEFMILKSRNHFLQLKSCLNIVSQTGDDKT